MESNYKFMNLKLVCVGLLLAVGAARWDLSHALSGAASSELAKGIRAELYASPYEVSITWSNLLTPS